MLQQGRVAQRGDHDQLAAQPGWYRDMYRYQQLEAALDDESENKDETATGAQHG